MREAFAAFIASTAKVVFFLLAFTACIGFWTQRLSEENFMKLSLMAFTFYFASKTTDVAVGSGIK